MLNTKIFGTRRGVTTHVKVKSKHTKRSLRQCECCKQMRHQYEVKRLGELPTVYVCKKCLEESEPNKGGDYK